MEILAFALMNRIYIFKIIIISVSQFIKELDFKFAKIKWLEKRRIPLRFKGINQIVGMSFSGDLKGTKQD